MNKANKKRGKSTKKIYDEFTDLPVSRQRKKQLRNIRDGLCSVCSKKIFRAGFCKKHYEIKKLRNKLKRESQKGKG